MFYFIKGTAVGAMMLIPAVLKAKLGVSEMVNSLMLNYVALYFIKYLLNSHLADSHFCSSYSVS